MRFLKLGVWCILGASVLGACVTESDGETEKVRELDAGHRTPDGKKDGGGGPGGETDGGPQGLEADGGDKNVGAFGKDGGVDIHVPGTDASVDAGPGPTFSVSGQLKLGNTVFRDSDVKNADSLYISNDKIDVVDSSKDDSIEISNPSTVAGYLGPIVIADAAGKETIVADNVDYYKVTLSQGQTVTLFTSEPAEAADGKKPPLADLDLFLLNEANADIGDNGAWVDDSMGIGDKEQVTAPETGVYWIAVERHQEPDDNGADDNDQALYSLAVGIKQTGVTMQDIAATKLSSKWPAVPGEALVRTAIGPQSADVAREVTYITYGQNAIGYARVSLNAVDVKAAARGTQDPRRTIHALKRLRKLGLSASPNLIFQHMAVPASNDPLLGSQWHYEQIDLAAAWAQTDQLVGAERGSGVVVAVLDTGVALKHPDFKNADGSSQLTTDGFDMIDNVSVAADGDGRDADPDDPGDGRTPGDSSFHGSHCAGTIAAATDNAEGGAGVAPNAKIMPVRVLGRGGGSLSDIIEGVLYAAGLENESGQKPTKKADIISMSLGGPGNSPAMAAAVMAARAEGVIVIAAAGNSNAPAELFSPGNENGVVTVSAADFDKKRAFYSNHGSAIDVAAPGGDTGADSNLDGQPDGVVSGVFKNGGATKYAAYQGTSMACPHVAGIAALMKSVWKNITPAQFDQAIAGGDIVVNVGSADDFGAGLINANKAVSFAVEQAEKTGEITPKAVLSVSSTVLDFGGEVTSLPLATGNTGKGTIEPVSAVADQPWVDASGVKLGVGTVDVDRTSLAPGVSTATVTITSNGGTQDVSIRVFKGIQPTGGDVDILYVMMVNPATGTAVKQVPAFRKEDGFLPDYGFEITDVPAGKYYLVAGSDMADTLFLGNDGDAYGAFPLSQDPQLICRLLEESDPECPQLSDEQAEAQAKSPNLTGAVIPIQLLIDLGAKEIDDAVAGASFTVASSPLKRPARIRRLR